jgi:hypothetical protein
VLGAVALAAASGTACRGGGQAIGGSVSRRYDGGCVIFRRDAAPAGEPIYASCGGRRPVAIAGGDQRWRFHPDGLRRRDRSSEDGVTVLTGTLLPIAEIRAAAERQPELAAGWIPDRTIDPALLRAASKEPPIAVDGVDAAGNPALVNAVVERTPGLVDDLLDAGADIEATTAFGDTPLMMAVAFWRTEALETLLARRAEVNGRDQRGETALMYAAKSNNRAMVERLLQAGADASLRDARGRSAADWAASMHDAGVMQLLPGGVNRAEAP